MNTINEFCFPNNEALVAKLAVEITEKLRKALLRKGKASLVVSGGSTPLPLFKKISKTSLDWENIWITLADERWVPPTHEASNEALVRKHLITRKAAKANFVGLWNDSSSPAEAQDQINQALKSVPQPFDAVVLGMGEDGHTASLFPKASELNAALTAPADALCLPMTPPYAPHQRMTLTKDTLLNCRFLSLHITGESKMKVFNNAKSGNDIEEMPIRAFIHQSTIPFNVYWTAR